MSRPPSTRPSGRASSSDLRLLRRLALRLHDAESLARLQEITARCPEDLWARQLEARALRAQGRCDEAIALLANLERGLAPAALLLFQTEAALDAGRLAEARRLLREGRERERDNLSIHGLLHLLAVEEAGLGSTPKLLDSFPPGAIWCPAVLGRLLLAVETELSRRLGGSGPDEAVRSRILIARSTLFRPQIDALVPPTYWLDRISAGFARVRGGPRLDRLRRREAIRAALRAQSLSTAATLTLAALDGGADADRRGWPDPLLALEILFLEGRWAEVVATHARYFKDDDDSREAYPAALAAGAALFLKETAAARAILAPPLAASGGTAELHHLSGLIELEEQNRCRAAALFRVAVEENDLTVMSLLSAELDCLDQLAQPTTSPPSKHEQATHEPST